MTRIEERSPLVDALEALALGEGFMPSRLPGVRFMRSTRHVPRSPIVYDPCIVIIARGRKVGRLGEREFVYDTNHYLTLTVPLPFECETFGSEREPLLGVSIKVTPALVTEILLAMDSASRLPLETDQVAGAAKLDVGMKDAAARLLDALGDPDDATVLGPQLVREIVYRAMRGPLGGNLRSLANPRNKFGQISRAVHRIHKEYTNNLEMEALASDAGMSSSAFYSHFKSVTGSSPLQYLKRIRLHRARLLMLGEGTSAARAALEVGYESASQFSREFKRYFGATPAGMVTELREQRVTLE